MKVKEFLDTLNITLLEKIEKLSKKLNTQRDYKNYKDFEDIVYGYMKHQINDFIKPVYKKIPAYMLKGTK